MNLFSIGGTVLKIGKIAHLRLVEKGTPVVLIVDHSHLQSSSRHSRSRYDVIRI